MTFSLHAMATETFASMLGDLSGVLEKGGQYEAAGKLDLVNAKLAPDMFTLAMQIKIACDHAHDTTMRLAGAEPVRNQDVDGSFDAMRARIAKTIAYVKSVPASAFAGAEDRGFEVPLFGGMVLAVTGAQLLKDWALPHFYFHVVTAYDILRHNGVEIGKRDYLAHIESLIQTRPER